MIVVLAVLAGGAGAVARYGVSGALRSPWGTAAVNVTGTVVLATLVAADAPSTALRVIGTGFCGGFTTFSTWMLESVQLTAEGTSRAAFAALGNVLGMLAAGLVTVAAVLWLSAP